MSTTDDYRLAIHELEAWRQKHGTVLALHEQGGAYLLRELDLLMDKVKAEQSKSSQ